VVWRGEAGWACGVVEIAIWSPSRRRVGLHRWDRRGMSTPNEKLREAAKKGDVAGVKAALRGGTKVNCADTFGLSPLHWASFYCHAGAIKALLAGGADVNAANKNGSTPLHVASRAGHVEAVKVLLASGAAMNAANKDGSSALYVASLNGHVDAAKALVAAGADPSIADKDGKWPIDVVCAYASEDRRANSPAITWILRAEMAWRRRKAAVCAFALGLWWG